MGKLYNIDMEQVGLHVCINQKAYPDVFDSERGRIIRYMTGTIIEVGSREPGSMFHGCVKIKFDEAMAGKMKQLGWNSDDDHWFLSGVLSEVRNS
jgi:hypothetical protein